MIKAEELAARKATEARGRALELAKDICGWLWTLSAHWEDKDKAIQAQALCREFAEAYDDADFAEAYARSSTATAHIRQTPDQREEEP